jgi:hypothetical protein
MNFLTTEDDLPIVHTPDINTFHISDEKRKIVYYINSSFFQDIDVIAPDMVEYVFSRFNL